MERILDAAKNGDVAQFRAIAHRYRAILHYHKTIWRLCYLRACRHGHVSIIEFLVKEHYTQRDREGLTEAIDHDQINVVEYLIKYIEPYNSDIARVFTRNNPGIVSMFLKNGLNILPAMRGVYQGGHVELIKEIQKYGTFMCDQHYSDLFACACCGGQFDLAVHILRYASAAHLTEHMLPFACAGGNIKIIELLRNLGHALNVDHLRHVGKHLHVIKYIVANMNNLVIPSGVFKCIISESNLDGIKLLLPFVQLDTLDWGNIFSYAKNLEILEFLYAAKPKTRAVNWNLILLYSVQLNNPIEIIRWIISRGPTNLNECIEHVHTAEVLIALLDAGANKLTAVPIYYVHALIDHGVTFKQFYAHKPISYCMHKELVRLKKKYNLRFRTLQASLNLPKVIIALIMELCECS